VIGMAIETVRIRGHIVTVTRSARGHVSLSCPGAGYHDQRWMPEERRGELMAITDIDEHCRRWQQEMNRMVNEAVVVARRAIKPTIRTRR
jgi:hypothetical protein